MLMKENIILLMAMDGDRAFLLDCQSGHCLFLLSQILTTLFVNRCANKKPASTQRCKVQDKKREECTGSLWYYKKK